MKKAHTGQTLANLNKTLIESAKAVGSAEEAQDVVKQLWQFQWAQALVLWENIPLDKIEKLPKGESASMRLEPAWAVNPSLTKEHADNIWKWALGEGRFLGWKDAAWTIYILSRRYEMTWQDERIQNMWNTLWTPENSTYGAEFYPIIVKLLLELPDLPQEAEERIKTFGAKYDKTTWQAGYLLAHSGTAHELVENKWAREFRARTHEDKQAVYKKVIHLLFHDSKLGRYGLDWDIIDLEWLKDGWEDATTASSPMAQILGFLGEPKRSQMVEHTIERNLWDIIGYWLNDNPDISGLSKKALTKLIASPDKGIREYVLSGMSGPKTKKTRRGI